MENDNDAPHNHKITMRKSLPSSMLTTSMPHSGPTRSHTQTFLLLRKTKTAKSHLEENRLQKRLEKLSLLVEPGSQRRSLNSPSSGSPASLLTSTITKSQRRQAEQAITPWQEDNDVKECPICGTPFSLTNRRRHCRLCGRVVCGVPARKCSLDLVIVNNGYLEMAERDDPTAFRICSTCRVIVSGRRELLAEKQSRPKYLILYQALMKHRKEIDESLPRFQEMVVMLRKRDLQGQSHERLQDASKIRKQLLDSFAKFDSLSKQIKTLDPRMAFIKNGVSKQGLFTQQRLQDSIHFWANQFLQTNMFPLEALPRLMHKDDKKLNGRASPAPSDTSSTRNQLGAAAGLSVVQEEKLSVLDEQIRLVEGYVENAQKQRKWEDWKVLKESLAELKNERIRIAQSFAM